MSLFGAILKQGAKYADNLFDDALVQAKAKPLSDADFANADWRDFFPADDPRFADGIPGFDPSLFEVRDRLPRPEHLPDRLSDFSPEQAEEYAKWKKANNTIEKQNRAIQSRSPEENARIAGKKKRVALSNMAETPEQYERINPPPFPGVDPATLTGRDKRLHKNWMAARSRAGAADPKRFPDDFDKEEWVKENPHPVEGYGERPISSFSDEETRAHWAWKKRMQHDAEKLKDDYEEIVKRRSDTARETVRRKKDDPHFRAVRTANAQARRAGVKQATTAGSDKDKIREIHYIANLISEITGEPHHVDHVVPIAGQMPRTKSGMGERSVSGLHHQNNLSIVPRRDNLLKGPYFHPGQTVRGGGLKNARALLKRTKEKYGLLDMPE